MLHGVTLIIDEPRDWLSSNKTRGACLTLNGFPATKHAGKWYISIRRLLIWQCDAIFIIDCKCVNIIRNE